jgi:hypothetical protein
VHLGHPAPDVLVFDMAQTDLRLRRTGQQLVQIERIQLDGTLCQTLFYAHMLQVVLNQRGVVSADLHGH